MHPVHKVLVGGVDPLLVWVTASVVDSNALVLGDLILVDFDIGDLVDIYFFELESVVKEKECLIMLIKIPLNPQGLAMASGSKGFPDQLTFLPISLFKTKGWHSECAVFTSITFPTHNISNLYLRAAFCSWNSPHFYG